MIQKMKEQEQTKSTNIKWHNFTINREKLEKMRGHKGMVIWFTGLSGSGKSTLANALNEVLHLDGFSTYVLDGDNIRHGLCKDLGFSDEDREENIRRIGEVANLFMNAGIITITAFVSPFIISPIFKTSSFIFSLRTSKSLLLFSGIIAINPIPQLKVCNACSFESRALFIAHFKELGTSHEFNWIFAVRPFFKTLGKLSNMPPPVI